MPFNGFPYDDILRDFDVFPKVLVKDKPAEINIRPTGGRKIFEPEREYTLVICGLETGNPPDYPATGDFKEFKIKCNNEGGFVINHTFDKEEMYFLRFLDDDGKRLKQFSVYCVDKDLEGRWPLRGDLHMHSTCSDGNQDPKVVCANYRKHGLDFMVVSDHGRYYPSIETKKFYDDVKTGLAIIPGEEVHMPSVYGQRSDFHIVNFGGEYSINALTDGSHTEDRGTGKESRSINGECPEFTPLKEWEAMIKARADAMNTPADVDAIPAAVCKWIFDEIRKANGLGIFVHPTWINNVYHVPNSFVDYITENRFFDAFEVLGGENYFEHNGFQTIKYYEDKAKGIRYPIVGSTDSHSSYPTNRNAFICSTLVFSPENERKAIIQSIRDFYSAAIDTISEEFRIVGENRFVRYGCFLLKNYFPLHDDLCFEEGRAMRQYATGTEEERKEAAALLDIIGDRLNAHRKKYFDF
ncbi:MAG: hypothetical protein K6F64_04855 [Clostridia bacterium]|nr:hypothetical protein [Clostridia bacterium]